MSSNKKPEYQFHNPERAQAIVAATKEQGRLWEQRMGFKPSVTPEQVKYFPESRKTRKDGKLNPEATLHKPEGGVGLRKKQLSVKKKVVKSKPPIPDTSDRVMYNQIAAYHKDSQSIINKHSKLSEKRAEKPFWEMDDFEKEQAYGKTR